VKDAAKKVPIATEPSPTGEEFSGAEMVRKIKKQGLTLFTW
jgi:hypothetical protein